MSIMAAPDDKPSEKSIQWSHSPYPSSPKDLPPRLWHVRHGHTRSFMVRDGSGTIRPLGADRTITDAADLKLQATRHYDWNSHLREETKDWESCFISVFGDHFHAENWGRKRPGDIVIYEIDVSKLYSSDIVFDSVRLCRLLGIDDHPWAKNEFLFLNQIPGRCLVGKEELVGGRPGVYERQPYWRDTLPRSLISSGTPTYQMIFRAANERLEKIYRQNAAKRLLASRTSGGASVKAVDVSKPRDPTKTPLSASRASHGVTGKKSNLSTTGDPPKAVPTTQPSRGVTAKLQDSSVSKHPQPDQPGGGHGDLPEEQANSEDSVDGLVNSFNDKLHLSSTALPKESTNPKDGWDDALNKFIDAQSHLFRMRLPEESANPEDAWDDAIKRFIDASHLLRTALPEEPANLRGAWDDTINKLTDALHRFRTDLFEESANPEDAWDDTIKDCMDPYHLLRTAIAMHSIQLRENSRSRRRGFICISGGGH